MVACALIITARQLINGESERRQLVVCDQQCPAPVRLLIAVIAEVGSSPSSPSSQISASEGAVQQTQRFVDLELARRQPMQHVAAPVGDLFVLRLQRGDDLVESTACRIAGNVQIGGDLLHVAAVLHEQPHEHELRRRQPTSPAEAERALDHRAAVGRLEPRCDRSPLERRLSSLFFGARALARIASLRMTMPLPSHESTSMSVDVDVLTARCL